VPLERQVIEKKDFPIGRRGYDPDAVDAHLSTLADEVEQLKSSSRRRTETLASVASSQVKAIVEAAESSAAAITRQAEDDAADIRSEASQEAALARQQASTQARDYVGQVSESTAVMLQRIDAMESELSALFEALRTGSNRLGADLQLLEGNLDDVKSAVRPRPGFEPETPGNASRPGRPASARPFAPEPDYEDAEFQAEPSAAAPVAVPEPAPGSPAAQDSEDDIHGARMVALNMALNGTPREETDRYLAENFSLSERERLVAEVYASVEG
jgi:DivIVA domain-containing protein